MLENFNKYIEDINNNFTESMSNIIEAYESNKDLNSNDLQAIWEKCKIELHSIMYTTVYDILILEKIELKNPTEEDKIKIGTIVSIFTKKIEIIINEHYNNKIKPIINSTLK